MHRTFVTQIWAAAAALALSLGVSLTAVLVAPDAYRSTTDARFVLAYHDRHPPTTFLIFVAAMVVWIARNASLAMRISSGVFAGAVLANWVAPYIWWRGVPDYIAVVGVIANTADVLLVAAALALLVLPLGRLRAHASRRSLERASGAPPG